MSDYYAFPHVTPWSTDTGLEHVHATAGMTLRDYFAARFAVAIYERHDIDGIFIAKEAYELADAMIEARGPT